MKKIVAIFVSMFAVSAMAADVVVAPVAPAPVVTKEKAKAGVKVPKKVKKAKTAKVAAPKVEVKK